MTTYGNDLGTFDEIINGIIDDTDVRLMYPDYLSGSVTIAASDGYSYHFDGLRGNIHFKTGMTIHKGDTLGTVWKCYHKIKEPHIRFSVTENGKVADPMSPFGIKSSFIPPQEIKAPDSLTADQAKEDLTVLFNAYEELYPSKYDIMTAEQDSLFKAQSYEKVENGISYENFYYLVDASTSAQYCHDSHITTLTPQPEMGDNALRPNLAIGTLGDSLLVYAGSKGNESYEGKRVVKINGKPAAEYVNRAKSNAKNYDALNRSCVDIQNITRWGRIYGIENIDSIESTEIEFADGSVYVDKWFPVSQTRHRSLHVNDIAYLRNLYARNNEKILYKFEQANDSTAVFTLRSFELNTVQLEEIADSIKANADVQNMIIDVRNNPGGDIEVLRQLLTYFINEKPVELEQYFKVNSNTTYPSLKYSQNYPENSVIFGDYEARNGKNGYYQTDSTLMNMMPDSLVNYAGKIYVLTGENTVSAASMFASYLVRNRRAVSVGRENGSGYHWMTALKFAEIILPNSRIQVRIPLVKSVFDDTITDRTPLGRGLLPDYEVPLTLAEYHSLPNDVIMEKALELIADGKYLSDENPFAEIDSPDQPLIEWWLILLAFAVGFLLIAIIKMACKSKGF